jgi:hypothetical protein
MEKYIEKDEKSCANCKYGNLSITAYPCGKCIVDNEVDNYWEPEEEKK